MSKQDDDYRFAPIALPLGSAPAFKRTMQTCPQCQVLTNTLRGGKCLRCSGWVCECGRPKTPEDRACNRADRHPSEHKPDKPRVLPYDAVARKRQP